MELGAETDRYRAWSGPAALLATRSRRLTGAQAEALLRDWYGLTAKASPLRSERDQNVLMSSPRGPRLVLKLSHALQDRNLPRFQTRALMHIAQVDPDLPVPKVIPTSAGQLHFQWDDGECPARLGYVVSFLEGAPLAEAASSPRLAANLGTLAARLGRALRGFFDAAAGHELLWDIKHAARLCDLLPFVRDDRDRRLATAAVGRFETEVAPRLSTLRAQVIHNDLNPHNLLVDPADTAQLTGVIDFGDMVHGALINDVAVAAAYLVATGEDPFALITPFVASYHAITPLEDDEIALLPDLIATRHAMTCAITGWRAERHPDNAAYILRNIGAAVRGLSALSDDGRRILRERVLSACDGGASS